LSDGYKIVFVFGVRNSKTWSFATQAQKAGVEDISFSAEPGQFTAIVGSTGAGKSTLVNLIPRFYDVTDGQILLDGVDIRDIPVEDYEQEYPWFHKKLSYLEVLSKRT